MKQKIKSIGLLLIVTIGLFFTKELNAYNLSSYILIDKAVDEGQISSEIGILYKIYRRYNHLKLPSEFYSEVSEPCGTQLWLEIRDNWSMLSVDIKKEIKKYVNVKEYSEGVVTFTTPIPPLDKSYSYGNIIINYTTTGINGVNPVDSDSDGIPDYIEQLAIRFQDNSWTKISNLGYFMPPAHYIVNVFE
ncbi:MAG: hypothetical protein Q7K21_01115, partial [Elusimicrobiota bacterium]|nr:hypothetical protein [Elusimicrobiota bacterium]